MLQKRCFSGAFGLETASLSTRQRPDCTALSRPAATSAHVIAVQNFFYPQPGTLSPHSGV
jgi:hypothetical protein